jgi:putative transposase
VCRYVERNPLRAGLVPRAEEWPWSSLKFDGGERPAWLAEWPVPRPVEWKPHVNASQTEAEVQAFRLAMKNRTPFGSDDWRQEVEELLGSAHGRRRGRPRKCTDEGVLFK